MTTPVLLQPWTGPLGGVPPLDRVEVSDFEPSIEAAMAEKRLEIGRIRDDPAPPTFANTFEAMERAGATLDRVLTVYYLWSVSYSSPTYRAVAQRMAPRLSAMHDDIFQDAALHARFVAAVESEGPGLSLEQQRLVERRRRSFRLAGAALSSDGRARVAAINQRLSTLYTTFSNNLLADEEGYVTYLDATQLGGLSESWRAAAAAAAAERGRPGAWAVTNTRSSVAPFLTTSTERDLREVVWRTYFSRGDNNDAHDNKALIGEILRLRLERAHLLGFETHAHLRLDGTMAGTPERALGLLRDVWSPAVDKFRREVEAMQALAARMGHDITIAPWDTRFYAERRQIAEYDFDPGELLEHYQLERLREGMFWAATERFGWTFAPIDVPVPHPDVRVWRVDNADGTPRGLFYFDPYARPGKRSGAWMSAYRSQRGLDGGALPIVSNNCNYQKGAGGVPTLLSIDQAETLFHEFGHAMHGLSSDVTYATLAGTSVPRDYVEFPSQLNEHWLTTGALLERFALHRVTGAPPPAALLARMRASANADSGFSTLEYLASAAVDLEMHLCAAPIDPGAFEPSTLTRWGLPSEVVMRHRTPQFAHVFSGDAYSAGYYSYLWADVLVADAAQAFAEVGFYDKPLSSRLMDAVLSRGDTVDPADGFRAFRGRDPAIDPLLESRGLR